MLQLYLVERQPQDKEKRRNKKGQNDSKKGGLPLEKVLEEIINHNRGLGK